MIDYYKHIGVGNFWSRNYIEYESNGDRNKTLSIKEYLQKIRPYLKYIINYLKKPDSWKTQLTKAINFISARENNGEHVMHSNTEIMILDKADEVTEELFQSLLYRHEIGLETPMKGSDFVFDCVRNVL